MKHFFATLMVFSLFLSFSTMCLAEENEEGPKTAYFSISLYELAGVVWVKAANDKPYPISTITMVGVNMYNPIGDFWGWSTEIGLGTPNDSSAPAPYIFSGPLVFLHQKFAVLPYFYYQLNPAYISNGDDMTHLLGGGVALRLSITEKIAFLLPTTAMVQLDIPRVKMLF